MSADNWAVCPECKKVAEANQAALRQQMEDCYGKVPISEFDGLRALAEAPIDEDKLHTFREDYEIYGAEDGEIQVCYTGKCSKCGAGAEFSHSHKVKP